ncbi:MAG TPA: PilZ domain-containing protein [Longimicrobiaceae bacterium]|nr:PilZ domain-containing protein [Longimicrobiaceae bacterium]
MQPVSLRIGEGEGAGWYPSLVLDFEEGREILVGAPTLRGDEVRVDPGTGVDVQTTHPDGLHVFVATVVGRAVEPAPALRITWPESVQRVQRREAVRVEVRLPVEVRAAVPGAAARELSGATVDLSERGMRAALPEPLAPGTELEALLHLPGGGPPLEGAGRGVRGGASEGAASGERFWTAVEFTPAPPATRRELTRFVFGVQREQLRGGAA